ncbi:MAG: DUF6325 family protein [Actinomycetes bacterium]
MTFGPVQMLILEFDNDAMSSEILPELNRLRDADLIRLIDLLIVEKAADGSIVAVETSDLGTEEAMEFGAIAGALIGLGIDGEEGAEVGAVLGAEMAADGSLLDGDVWYVADAIPPGSMAVIALIEHTWAIPLRTAIKNSGGIALADEWIHPEDLIAIGIEAAGN